MRSRLPTPAVLLLQVVAIVVLLASTGAVAGVLWNHLWDPPIGEVQQGVWAVFTEAGLRADFAGVALYVVIAVGAGLLTGAICGLIFDRSELLSLVVVLGSAVLAGWVMWQVGVHRSPPDPQRLAAGLADGARLPGHLRLHSRTPFVSFPIGTLVGFALVLIAIPKHGSAASGEDPSESPAASGQHGLSRSAFPGPDAG